MTYCSKADHLNRQVDDLTTLAREDMAKGRRMKQMAWNASAARAHHLSTCPACKGVA